MHVDKTTPQVWYGVRAKVHEHWLAQRRARQVVKDNSNKENRYMIKVLRFKQGRGWIPLVRENQRLSKAKGSTNYQAF